MATCAILSFRLGLTDGVSVVAALWQQALTDLGFDTVTVAGEGPVDVVVPGLSIDADEPPSPDRIRAALGQADLVIVENLGTIPLNLPASRVVNEVLAGRPAVYHHHDPPWQRERFAAVTELPADDPAWAHVTINRLTEREMTDRGFEATTIYNGFEIEPAPGDRAGARRMIEVGAEDLLCVHPVRAIERKGIPRALELTAALGGIYWLPGGAEEDYGSTLELVLAEAVCPVRHARHHRIEDIYAAGDLVVFPSTWEGFGNPPIEAAIHRKPAAVGEYPVAEELRELGFEWFPTGDVEPARSWLDHPDPALLDHNQAVARTHLSTDVMRDRLRSLLAERGWLP